MGVLTGHNICPSPYIRPSPAIPRSLRVSHRPYTSESATCSERGSDNMLAGHTGTKKQWLTNAETGGYVVVDRNATGAVGVDSNGTGRQGRAGGSIWDAKPSSNVCVRVVLLFLLGLLVVPRPWPVWRRSERQLHVCGGASAVPVPIAGRHAARDARVEKARKTSRRRAKTAKADAQVCRGWRFSGE